MGKHPGIFRGHKGSPGQLMAKQINSVDRTLRSSGMAGFALSSDTDIPAFRLDLKVAAG